MLEGKKRLSYYNIGIFFLYVFLIHIIIITVFDSHIISANQQVETAKEAFYSGELLLSMDLYVDILNKEPENQKVKLDLAVISEQIGDLKGALYYYEEALKQGLDPAISEETKLEIGWLLYRLGEYEKARKYLDELIGSGEGP